MSVFNDLGLMEPGIYPMTMGQLGDNFGFSGRRRYLLSELERFLRSVEGTRMGIIRLIINGSFVTDKEEPGDIDLHFVIDTKSLLITTDLPTFANLMDHDFVKLQFSLDSYCNLDVSKPTNNLVEFFQYIGPKTAAIKQLNPYDLKGIVELVR